MIRALIASVLAGAFAVETPVPTPARSAATPTPSPAAANSRRLFVQDVAWSPDGRHFAFSRYDAVGPYAEKNWTVWIADRDGANARVVLRGGFYAAFSPDGDRLTCGMLFDGDWEVVTVRTDGTDLRRLTNRVGKDYLPVWSPDGKFVVYCSEVEGNLDLYRIGVDGKGLRRLTNDLSHDYNPAFSPDGKRIVFYRELGDQHDQIWTLDLTTGHQTRITDGTGHNFFPAFLPDGRIEFSGQPDRGERRLTVISKDGARFEPLGPPKIFFARWSPDGSEVLYLTGGEKLVRRMAADGTGVQAVLDIESLTDAPQPR